MINLRSSEVQESLESLNKAVARLAEVAESTVEREGLNKILSLNENLSASARIEFEKLKLEHASFRQQVSLVIKSLDDTIGDLDAKIFKIDKEP